MNHTTLLALRWASAALLLSAPIAGCRGGARTEQATTVKNRAHDPQSRVDLARRFHEQGLDSIALAELERIVATNPRLTTAHLGIGDIYRESGDYVKAEKQYATAADLEPSNFDAQYFHGLTLQLLNRIADAVAAYLRALTIKPNDFDANLNVTTAYLQLSEPRQALVYARRSVTLKPDSGPARANLGSVYSALNDHDAAIVEYQQAAELMDLTPELLLNLANSFDKKERYAEMENTLQQAIRIKASPAAYERLGSAQFRTKKYAEALASFRSALELDPDYYPALNDLGVSRLCDYLWSEKTDRAALEEAMKCFRRSLQIERQQPEVLKLLQRYN